MPPFPTLSREYISGFKPVSSVPLRFLSELTALLRAAPVKPKRQVKFVSFSCRLRYLACG